MGTYWLHDCVGPLSAELGNYLKFIAGYETRSTRFGGLTKICGIIMHHDADPPSGSDDNATRYCAVGSQDSPIGNFHCQRDGDVYMMAAGASNHAGRGGPVTTSKGTVAQNDGNRNFIGIEASNDGVGEPWKDIQLDNYLKLVTTLCKVYKLDPNRDIYLHHSWCQPSCPGRKIDPRGPTPKYPKLGGSSGVNIWNLAEVRKEISARLQNTPTTPPPTQDWAALGATYTTPPATLKLGQVHANVPWLQAVLCSLKLYNSAWVGVDSVNGAQQKNLYGDATLNAVKGFQQKYNLTMSGTYDTVTAEKMYSVRGK